MEKIKEITPVYVDTMPEQANMETGKIYLSKKYPTAIHKCACGCGEQVVTPLGEKGWKLTDQDGQISLYPSIGNWGFKCRSHYFIKDNKIIWC